MSLISNSCRPPECRIRNQTRQPSTNFLIVQMLYSLTVDYFFWGFFVCFFTMSVTVWFSSVVAHLLEGPVCCAIRNALHYTFIVKCGYLSTCSLSIICNHAGHYPADHFHQQRISAYRMAAH